jgi:DNA-binding CsgD family transcriptional regulator
MNAEDHDDTIAWANRALEVARALDDAEPLVYALTNVGAVQLLAAEPDARATLERALELARLHGLEEHAGRAFCNLTWWPVRDRMYTFATGYIDAGLEYCAEHGLDTWRLYLLAARARLELDTGRWDDAADTAAVVLRDPRSAVVPRGWALVTLALVLARRGEPGGSRLLDQAHALADSSGELQRLGPVAAARAETAWMSGQSASVEKASAATLALALRYRSRWVAGELAYWRRQAGLRDELPSAAVAEPYRLSLAGEWAAAADQWATIGCPYEAALALAGADDPSAVRQSIERLQQLGAWPAVAIASRRLRERGERGVRRGPRPATRENPAGLTARELEVLALLAEGLHNAQIAQRLVVTEKTVEHHVSAVLRKLNARTRHDAAGHAARLGLTPPGPEPPGQHK